MTNPVFPGRTTTDTMGEVAVGGEAGWREERAVMALSSFMFQMDKKTRFCLRGGFGSKHLFFPNLGPTLWEIIWEKPASIYEP
jgi:hypothetical protein